MNTSLPETYPPAMYPPEISSPETYARETGPDPRVIAALCGGEASSDRALALRTRRSVYNAIAARRSDRVQERRSLLLALLLIGALALALAPALWAGVDEIAGGGSLLDLPGMLIALGMTMSAAVAAVLFLVFNDRRSPEQARNGRR